MCRAAMPTLRLKIGGRILLFLMKKRKAFARKQATSR
jgi:hypothetical protein